MTEKEGKISNYAINGQIGQGSYAIVKQGLNKKTNKRVAIKIYDKYKVADTQRKTSMMREISLLRRLNHPHIVRLYEVIENTRQIYLVTELVNGKSLRDYVRSKVNKRLSEKEAFKIFKQVLSGIEYCHKLNVTHRDIKMENILLDENQNAKLIDFGFSICSTPTQHLKVFCGTPSYMAPEVVSRKEYLGPPSDMWSMGVLLYMMTTGNFPFKGLTDRELFRNIMRGSFVYPSHLSMSAKSLINKMLTLNPNKRGTASQVYQYLIE